MLVCFRYLFTWCCLQECSLFSHGLEVAMFIAFMFIQFIWEYVSYDLFRVGSSKKWFFEDVAVSVVLAPAAEEILTRFYFMKVLLVDFLKVHIVYAGVLANFMFLLLHVPFIFTVRRFREKARGLTDVFTAGLLITILYCYSGFNLMTAVFLHGVMNLYITVIDYFKIPKSSRRL